jgi:hypothetical protein
MGKRDLPSEKERSARRRNMPQRNDEKGGKQQLSLFLPCRFSVGADGQRMDVRQTQSVVHHGDNHGGGLCCLLPSAFHKQPCPCSFLSLSRMSNVAARNTSWVVIVAGTTSTAAFTMLGIGNARTTMCCGRLRAFVRTQVSPPNTRWCHE